MRMINVGQQLRRFAALVCMMGLVAVLASCGSGDSSAPAVQSIEVTPNHSQAAAGTTVLFLAIAVYSDGTHINVTSQVAWKSSNATVATLGTSPGMVAAVGTGNVTISATLQGVSGNVNFTVTPAVLVSIEVTPTTPTVPSGMTAQLTATGVFSDHSTQDLTAQVTWASTSSAVASISNAAGANGLISAKSVGTTTISATSANISGSTTLTVKAAVLKSIEVTPTLPSVANGVQKQFTATGIFSDSTTQDLTSQVIWSSSTVGVATVSNVPGTIGLASTTGTGVATITANSGAISGNTILTVTAASLVSIQVTPANPSIANGLTEQFTATGTYTDSSHQDLTNVVTWGSSAQGIATISNAAASQGNARSLAPGATTISATIGSISGSNTLTVTAATLMTIQVTPTNPSIPNGLSEQFAATGIYTDESTHDLSTQVTWSSTSSSIATVSNAVGSQGLASAAGTGNTTITATSGGVSGSTLLRVSAATLVSIQVTPANPSIGNGSTEQFTATGLYTDNSTLNVTTQVTWISTTTSAATISNGTGSQGLASSTGLGSTTMTATVGGISGTTTLTVTSATLVSIQVTPANPSIANGLTEQFTATGRYTDNSTQNLTAQVTWASTNPSAATISNAAGSQGLASSASADTTTITATSVAVSGNTALTVTAATLTAIQITPANTHIVLGASQQYTATGTYTDSSTQIITTAVTWASSNTNTAAISNAVGSQGLATSVDDGTTTITATTGSISGVTSLGVAMGWSWMSGSTTNDAAGNYGTQGTAAAGNVPDSRYGAASWKDNAGNFWLFAGEGNVSGGSGALNDLWMYSPSTQLWTWASGSSTSNASGAYGTEGTAAAGNVPGAREFPISWTDSAGNLWMFGGLGYDMTQTHGYLNDLWMYSPSTQLWTWMSGSNTSDASGVYGTQGTAAANNVPGARAFSVSWTDVSGNFWLFGGYGVDSNGNGSYLNDLWMFNPTTKLWIWVNGSTTTSSGVYGTQGTAAAGNVPGARTWAMSWTDATGNLWLFGGYGNDSAGNQGHLNDLWVYSQSTQLWTWVSGSTTDNVSGAYGTQGTAATGNVPGGRLSSVSWTDAAGNLWLFGGHGYDSTGAQGLFDDTWMYSPSTQLWTWVGGSSTTTLVPGVYGTEGIAALGNLPGAREYGSSWFDSAGKLWLFGGYGSDSTGSVGYLNDLWSY